MNLETLQEMWKKDSEIDPDKYGEESVRTVSYTHLTLPTICSV